MVWLSQFENASDVKRHAERALSLPIGMASPLWLAFGAAASAGVAWWWMTRWTRQANVGAVSFWKTSETAPASLIALGEPETMATAPVEVTRTPEVEPITAAWNELEVPPEAVSSSAPEIGAQPAPVNDAAAASDPEVEPKAAPPSKTKAKSEPIPDGSGRPDELTRMIGVGPRVADALVARGVTRFSQLAAWTTEDLVNFDAQMRLKGRGGVHNNWIAQAKRLAAEG